jgi:NAD(P)-dependent dehydrogenase (short-subunit alcohol dehydrogenase family)
MSQLSDRKPFWSARRVMVTGGGGSFGSFVVERLRAEGVKQVFVPRSRDYDLVDPEAVRRAYRDGNPDMVMHLAAVVGLPYLATFGFKVARPLPVLLQRVARAGERVTAPLTRWLATRIFVVLEKPA